MTTTRSKKSSTHSSSSDKTPTDTGKLNKRKTIPISVHSRLSTRLFVNLISPDKSTSIKRRKSKIKMKKQMEQGKHYSRLFLHNINSEILILIWISTCCFIRYNVSSYFKKEI